MIRIGFFGMAAFICSCEYVQLKTPVDCSASTLGISLVSVTDADCGVANGSLEVTGTDGAGAYTYALQNQSNSTGVFSDLSSGTYTIMVTDSTSCSVSMDVSVANADGINIASIETTDSGCGTENGAITVNATGGQTPYSFTLNQSTTNSTGFFSGLGPGEYDLVASDQSGCEITETVTLLTGITYSGTVAAIISGNCATSGCHNGSQSPNLSTIAKVQSNARKVKSETASGAMPPNKKLSQTQIDAIGCWVDDGALNN